MPCHIVLAVLVLAIGLEGCRSNSNPSSQSFAPSLCSVSSDQQVEDYIDGQMATIKKERDQVTQCYANWKPSDDIYCALPARPSYCTDFAGRPYSPTQTAYDFWLADVSKAINGSVAPVSDPSTNWGLGSQYGKDAQGAQSIDQHIATCNGNASPASTQSSDPARSFSKVGINIFEQFRYCSKSLQDSASNYLQNTYAW
jgi:hypothetical protein